MSSSASKPSKPRLPSNLPNQNANEYEFNSIGFYGGLLSRLDDTIRNTEDIYKQSFYIVSSYRNHESPSLNHFMRADGPARFE